MMSTMELESLHTDAPPSVKRHLGSHRRWAISLASLLVASCGDFDDIVHHPAPIDAGPWSAVPVPGVNIGMEMQDEPSCTPDRNTIVFASARDGVGRLFIGTRATTGGEFTVNELTTLNAIRPGDKASPEIDMFGTTIYFTASDIGPDLHDVYMSQKAGDTWGTPTLVPELSDPNFDDSDVAISPDGLTAMVARGGKLYVATWRTNDAKFSTPVSVPITVDDSAVSAPSITNDAKVVYLHAGTPRELYYTQRDSTSPEVYSYAKPARIMELDTQERNSAPFVSQDQLHMLFARDGNIYEATR